MIRKAFTLVELLVVIGVIAVLLSILMPALATMRASSRVTQCANNLRALGVAENFYASLNGNYLTPCFVVGADQPNAPHENWLQAWQAPLWADFGKAAGIGNGKTVTQVVNGQTFIYPESKMMLCPAQENVWDIYFPNSSWGPVFYSDYVYVGNPRFSPTTPAGTSYGPYTSLSYWADYKSIPHRMSDGPNLFVAGDVVISPPVGAGAYLYYTNHGPPGYTTDHKPFKGVNQLFLDGHVAWKPSTAFPAVFNNQYGTAGNASFVHWPGNPYCIYW